MPSISDNLNKWSNYDWSEKGDEWSAVWGGTSNLWHGSVYPRIQNSLPAEHVLEIAPGFGRITQFLKDECATLTIVDVTSRCIDACRERFADDQHIRYIVNDGLSLRDVADETVDFAFSFDSLVHVELDVMEGYLRELGRVLRPEGTAFLHHSNLAAFKTDDGDGFTIANRHWRGATVSAALIRDYCSSAGLHCVRQEMINWGTPHLTDCLTHLARRGSGEHEPCQLVENPHFMQEAQRTRAQTDG